MIKDFRLQIEIATTESRDSVTTSSKGTKDTRKKFREKKRAIRWNALSLGRFLMSKIKKRGDEQACPFIAKNYALSFDLLIVLH